MSVELPGIGLFLVIEVGLPILGIIGSILIARFHTSGRRLKNMLKLWMTLGIWMIAVSILFAMIWAGVLGTQIGLVVEQYSEFIPLSLKEVI